MLSSETTTADDLIQEFGPDLASSASILEELLSLCNRYSVSADVLNSKWEELVINAKNEDETGIEKSEADASASIPNFHHIETLRANLHKEYEARVNKFMGLSSVPLVKVKMEDKTLLPPSGRFFDKDSLQEFLDSQAPSVSFPKTPVSRPKVKVRGEGPPSSTPRMKHEPNSFTPVSKPPMFMKTPGDSSSRSIVMSSSPAGKPNFNSSHLMSSPSVSSVNFSGRQDRNVVRDTLNSHIPIIPSPLSNPAARTITILHNQQVAGYRYMFEKLTEMGDLIDDRIDQMSTIIEKDLIAHRPSDMNFDTSVEDGEKVTGNIVWHPGHISPEPFFTVGRVCCDSPLDEVRLNDSSIMLESSRTIGSGGRVYLSFSDMLANNKPVALFPGQIIGVYGSNPTGKQINVSKVVMPPKLPKSATTIKQIQSFYPATNAEALSPVNVVVAGGPFTLEDSLAYEPLEALTETICIEKPDVVVLLGPFVDSMHPELIKSSFSGDEIFAQRVSPSLRRILDARPNLNLILIPSTRDFCTEWVGYPQPPLACTIDPSETFSRREELGLNIRGQEGSAIHLLPNPTQFTINEILFAVSTADAVSHISSKEWARVPNQKGSDRIARMYEHMLDQRHLYPLSPPSHSEHFSVDQTRLSSGAVTLQATPDVLIVPSPIKPGSHVVDGSICINPGHLSTLKAAGTYAKICVHPMPPAQVQAYYDKKMSELRMKREAKMETDNEEEENDRTEEGIVIGHAADKRTRVDVVKI